MPDKPTEREIWFARARRRIADAVLEFYRKPVEDHGFEVREGGVNVDTPSSHLEEDTLLGQEMKVFVVFRDDSGQEYRVDFVISHSEDWDAILDIYSSVGGPKPSMIMATDEAVARGIDEMRRYYFNLIERIKKGVA